MSLSRPARFPLLKLPWLCIKCVLHNSDLFDIICFATISTRTRRIVKCSKYPLKEIDVHLSISIRICIRNVGVWYVTNNQHGYGVPLVLQKNAVSFRTEKCFSYNTGGHWLHSYTSGDKLIALKMSIDFMINVFGCSIREVYVDVNKISELSGLGIRSVKQLLMSGPETANTTDLKHLLETIEVTDKFVLCFPIPKDFYCDPRIFKCRELSFPCHDSADWITLEILCQLDVSQLTVSYPRSFTKYIVPYINYWFNSENRKLEYFHVSFLDEIEMENFKIDHLNPMPFCEKRRSRFPFAEDWKHVDMSSGMDILREDGLLATFFVQPLSIFFYIWHKRFPDTA